MRRVLPLVIAIIILFILRLSNLSIRLSDSNIYFYTAYEILNGKLLYKDIFFTNFPLFPHLSALYLFATNNNILFYYLTPTIEISIISFLIYHLVYKKTKDNLTALASAFLYIYSFMVLATSEHQTGVFQSSFFAVLAYFFWQRKKYLLVGIFLALTLLTKAYFIPIILAFFITLLLKKRYKNIFTTFYGIAGTTLIILLPFLLFAPHDIYNDIIKYSLTRTAGVSKLDVMWFFIIKDFFFFVLLIFNIFNFRNNVFFSLLGMFSVMFFLFYTDTYYLYFNFLPPFLCLSLPYFITTLQKQLHLQKFVFPTLLLIFLIYTFSTYFTSFRNLGTFTNMNQLISLINQHNPAFLYGVNDATPAIAFLTNTPLLNGIVDTNANIFRKGILNATYLTNMAVQKKAMIITHGAYYPAQNVNETAIDEIVDKKILLRHCTLIHSHPIYSEGITNRLNLFSCK